MILVNTLRLFSLQKKGIRIIFNASYYAHTTPIFKELKLLNVYDINNFNIAIFMFLCSRGLLPLAMLSTFVLNSNVHCHNTRNSVNYHLPKIRTNISKNSIFFKGPVLWNQIPPDLKNSPSLNCFKQRYKCYLLICIHPTIDTLKINLIYEHFVFVCYCLIVMLGF